MKGFTVIELLIVVGISAMLASIAITYTNVAKNQVGLSVEAAKVSGAIFRAKDLAIATFNTPPPPGGTKTCGYGVKIDIGNNNYSIFSFKPDSGKSAYSGVDLTKFCPNAAQVKAGGISANEMASTSQATWRVPLANSVRFFSGGAGDDLNTVLFYPPDPLTYLSSDGLIFLDPATTLRVRLSPLGGITSSTISVNPVGQITF